MFRTHSHRWLAGALLLALLPTAQAGVTLSGTRIIFDASKRDASITAGNGTDKPYAVQAWVNTEEDDHAISAPFIATPPLFRLDAMKEQMVRIVPTAHNLPTDRESVFYFNAQEIPAASNDDGNTLKIALRTRIKLFYRPKGCRAACSSPATAGVGDPPGGRRSAPAGVQPNAVPRLVHPYQGGRRRRDNESTSR
jgi:P pilus assembly chaperone PapD